MCLHGLARHEPDKFSAFTSRLKKASSAEATAKQAEHGAKAEGKSVYDKQGLYGAQSSTLHAAELAARKDEAAAKTESLQEAQEGLLEALLAQDVCVDGALAFLGRSNQWLYRATKKVPAGDVDATGGTTGDDAGPSTAATSSWGSRHPTIDAARRLQDLPSVDEVRRSGCECGERCGDGLSADAALARGVHTRGRRLRPTQPDRPEAFEAGTAPARVLAERP